MNEDKKRKRPRRNDKEKEKIVKKTKYNEKELEYNDLEDKLKTLGNENFGLYCNPVTGYFVWPKDQPIIITVVGSTGSGKTTFVKNTILTTIKGFSDGSISVLFLQHNRLNQLQEKLSTLHAIVADLEFGTYDNWLDTIKTFVNSKKNSSPKVVILDDFTDILNRTKISEEFRVMINTLHNHRNTSYIIVSHTATAENTSSKGIGILKKESKFLIISLAYGGRMLMDKFISGFPADIKETIKAKVKDFVTHRLAQTDISHVMINLTNGMVFDDSLRLIT